MNEEGHAELDPYFDEDDFQELLGFLYEAKERYRTVCATIIHTVDGAVAKESNRRFVDWQFAQGYPGMGVMGNLAPPVREDFHREYEYEDAEWVVRLWHERPDRWREDWRGTDGTLLSCIVAAGRKDSLWIYDPPQTAIHVPSAPEGRDPDPFLAFMLDPSVWQFSRSLLEDVTIHKTGRRATVAGRETLEVKLETLGWNGPPVIFPGPYVPDGTTDHLLLVDMEVGTILRAAARLEGREFYVAEVAEIAYDERFPEDTFRLELPGVEFRRVDP